MQCWAAAAILLCAAATPLSGASLHSIHPIRTRTLQQDASCEPIGFDRLVPTITRAPVADLQWLDKNDLNVLAITRKYGVDAGGLWLSSDGGKHWAEKTQLLNASLPLGEPVDIISVLRQKSNPANLVLLGTGSFLWTSSDYGVTFTPRQTPTRWRGAGIKSLKIHPRKDGWMLMLVKRPTCRPVDRAQTECPADLLLTKDLFSGNPTWKNLTEDSAGKIAGFVDFDWGANLCPGDDCGPLLDLPDDLVFATMYQTPGAYDQPWDPDVNFVTSRDWFATFQTHVRCGNMFEVVGSTIYLAIANSCPTDIMGEVKHEGSIFPQGITLYTSQDAGCTFNQACLPVAVKQEGYELMETHDGTGVIIIVDFLVNNGMFDIPASSVYTAGPHAALFSLSLTDVYHADYGSGTDFTKVDGLPGVYIANQMLARPDTGAKAPPAAKTSDSSYYYSDYTDLSDSTGQPMVESRITYNGGGRWQRLQAPTAFQHSKCNRCGEGGECYLHLNGMSSWQSFASSMPAVYANPSAPGLIMASGNVGPPGVGLGDNDGLCTWLSIDGGVTWRDVAVGAYIYEFADWGGLVIMARHPGAGVYSAQQPAESIMFSMDYGRCWQTVQLAEALLVDNIRIEPDGQRPRVVVHGRRCSVSQSKLCAYADTERRATPEGVMYLVDVQELMSTRVGLCSAADRELWGIPADGGGAGTRCVLGRQSLLERRRPSSICYNGPDYKRPLPVNTSCACTLEADTECDYGYLKMGSSCLAIPPERMPFCPAITLQHYTVSSTARRQVHADSCTAIKAVVPDLDTEWRSTHLGDRCIGVGTGRAGDYHRMSALFGFFIFLLVSGVLAGLFAAWWKYLATELQRDLVRDLAAGVVAAGRSCVLWVREKIGGRRAAYESDLHYFQPLGDMGDGMDDHDHERSLFTLK